MDSPCTNHAYPVKHLYKDSELLKCFLQQIGGPKEGDGKEATAKKGGTTGKDGDGFPDPEECIMIFGGSDAIWSKRHVTPRVFKILKPDMSSYALQSIWHLVKTLRCIH